MKKIFFLSLMVLSGSANGQGVWQWAKSCTDWWGNISIDIGWESWQCKADLSDNVFIIGRFDGDSVQFGSYTFYNPGDIYPNQAVIVKYDPLGNILWAKSSINGPASPMAVTTDLSGNAYVFGFYNANTIQFGTYLLTAVGSCGPGYCGHYYLIKYDPLGNIVWVKNGTQVTYSGAGAGLGDFGIATDSLNAIYITSSFDDTTIQIGGYILTNPHPPTGNGFVAKYDSAGNVVWARAFGGGGGVTSQGIAVNKDRVYLTGYSNSSYFTFTFDTVTLISTGMYLVALDTAGHGLWAITNEGEGYSVGVDRSSSIYVGGNYNSDTAFLIKYDSSGATIWSNNLYSPPTSGSGFDNVYSLALDNCNNVWVAGNMRSTGISVSGSVMLAPAAGSTDPMFLAGYDSLGTLINYATLASAGDDYSGISTDMFGNIYLCGDYQIDPFIFGPDSLHLYNGITENIFVAKYHTDYDCALNTLSVKNNSVLSTISIYPNPATTDLTITTPPQAYNACTITSAIGQLMMQQPMPSAQTTIDIKTLPPGMYYIMFAGETGSKVEKFEKL